MNYYEKNIREGVKVEKKCNNYCTLDFLPIDITDITNIIWHYMISSDITVITDIIWHHLTSPDIMWQPSPSKWWPHPRSQELNFSKWNFPIFSNLSLLTFPFITSTKLGCFQDSITVLESALNLLSPGLISCLIMFSFDIDMIRHKFYFRKNLCRFFWKNMKKI